ncbi:hypothetical protein FACS189493_2100 [Spirochaetia bacterium]|nr:hypothetical protein FACS189493_2100 [Spirochaetia bacterium]
MKKEIAGLLMFIGLCAAVSAQNAADFNVALTADGTGVVITGYTGNGGAVTIPATIEGLPVKEIGERAFANERYGQYSVNTTITAVTFPDGLEKIGAYAFASVLAPWLFPTALPKSEEAPFFNAIRNRISSQDLRSRLPG